MSRAKPGMHVTAALIRRKGACNGAAAKRLRRDYPNGVRVTQKICERYAHSREFRWDWAATHLLNEAGKAEFKRLVDHIAAAKQNRLRVWKLEFGRYDIASNGISDRALEFCKASIFGMLAEQRRYDPAFTPD